MELKRRFIHNQEQHQHGETEVQDGDSLISFADEDTEPGIPPRKAIHSKPRKKPNKLALGYTLSLTAILFVLGGSGWWMKSQISQPATAVLTPEVKLEQNEEVQNQKVQSNEVQSKEIQEPVLEGNNVAKAEQPSEQEISKLSPTVVPQQTKASEVTKPVKAKPVYKKLLDIRWGLEKPYTVYR